MDYVLYRKDFYFCSPELIVIGGGTAQLGHLARSGLRSHRSECEHMFVCKNNGKNVKFHECEGCEQRSSKCLG